MKDLSYSTLCRVLETWEKVRRLDDFHVRVGTLLYQKLFVKVPEAKILFQFAADADPMSNEMKLSKLFQSQAHHFIEMLDSAIDMIGPELGLLTEIFEGLGEKHVCYGVTANMYPIMGECLSDVFEELINDQYTEQHKTAWKELYGDLTTDMLKAYSSSSPA